MANPGVFYDALDSFLAERGYDQSSRKVGTEDGHMIRFHLAAVRNSACGLTGPCVETNIKQLLFLMKNVPDWTTEMAESALRAAGLKE